MTSAVLLAALLSQSPTIDSEAPPSLAGMGRISVHGSYRLVLNDYFAARAAEAGTPISRKSIGGPGGVASFGYGATEWLEVAIDAFVAYDAFALSLPDGSVEEFSNVSYGALLGVRITTLDFPFKGLIPYLSFQLGPTLSTVASRQRPGYEKLQSSYVPGAGLTYRFAERFGISLDVKWMYARGFVEGISGINVGGFWFSLGFTVLFPSAPKRDLDVPKL